MGHTGTGPYGSSNWGPDVKIGRREEEFVELENQIEKLQKENKELRKIMLKRFISCVTGGSIKGDSYVAQQWNWYCGLCGAASSSDNDKCNLVHTIDCPLYNL